MPHVKMAVNVNLVVCSQS